MSVTSPLCWRAPHFSWVLLSCLFPCRCSSSLFSVFHLEQPPVAHNLAQGVHFPRPHLFQGLSPLGLDSFAASLPSVSSSFVHALRIVVFFTPLECIVICHSFWPTDSTHSFFSSVDTDLLFSNTFLLSSLGIQGLQPILSPSSYPCTQQLLIPLGPDFHG